MQYDLAMSASTGLRAPSPGKAGPHAGAAKGLRHKLQRKNNDNLNSPLQLPGARLPAIACLRAPV